MGKTRWRRASCRSVSDHPHARGENFVAIWNGIVILRTIPTHVGKTRHRLRQESVRPDHPHARGENPLTFQGTPSESGPSPRTWGKRVHRSRTLPRARTIPTHVGKTLAATRHDSITSDHPHARGENRIPGSWATGPTGPSPRTWGKPHDLRKSDTKFRTIPTHVGKTQGHAELLAGIADHPHARGENHDPGI